MTEPLNNGAGDSGDGVVTTQKPVPRLLLAIAAAFTGDAGIPMGFGGSSAIDCQPTAILQCKPTQPRVLLGSSGFKEVPIHLRTVYGTKEELINYFVKSLTENFDRLVEEYERDGVPLPAYAFTPGCYLTRSDLHEHFKKTGHTARHSDAV